MCPTLVAWTQLPHPHQDMLLLLLTAILYTEYFVLK